MTQSECLRCRRRMYWRRASIRPIKRSQAPGDQTWQWVTFYDSWPTWPIGQL